jgi:hypothetical protein
VAASAPGSASAAMGMVTAAMVAAGMGAETRVNGSEIAVLVAIIVVVLLAARAGRRRRG